jgi:hypothetical protein
LNIKSRRKEEWEKWEDELRQRNNASVASNEEGESTLQASGTSSSESESSKQEEDETKADASDVAPSTQARSVHAYPDRDYGFHPYPYMAPWMFIPEYLEVNLNNLTICFLRSPMVKPGRCEVPSPYDELVHQRAFDFYSKYRRF